MSKMKDMYMEQNEEDFEAYLEDERMELRREGAEELRKDILRELEYSVRGASDDGVRYGLTVAMEYVRAANI